MKANCFSGDTEVLTSFGLKRIDSIKEGDKIVTRQGYKKATRCILAGDRKVKRWTIIYEDKVTASITCTEMHKMFTDLGWIPIKCVTEGMYMCRKDCDDLVKVSFIGSDDMGYDFCYDLEVADEHEYYANGLLVRSI